jgi:hypothetical protein
MSEYIIIVAMVAVSAIRVFTAFRCVIRQQVTALATKLSGGDGTAAIEAAVTNAGHAAGAAGKVTDMGTYANQKTPAP